MYQLETLLAVWEDEAGKGSSLFTDEALCVPPDVTLDYCPPTSRPWNFPLRRRPDSINEPGPTPVLRYPLPQELQVPLASTMLAYGGLLTNGWKWLESSTGVFDDFLRLADVPATAILAEEACSKVVAFARKWGPIWICRTPVHTDDCYWRPDISVLRWTSDNPHDLPPELLRYQKKNPCQWIPMEEVEVFLQKARQVKTLFEAIVRLQNGEPVAESLWRLMGVHETQAPPLATASRDEQFRTLCSVLRVHLYWCSEFRIGLGWDNRPKLKIVPPLGFIHVVLFTLAQLLCQARGVYQCDGCGNFYIRTRKRPQTGKRNFCPQCGPTASKRQWAQRKRQDAK